MRISRKAFPEKNDLVIGVVNRIEKHGIYVTLKEFNNVEGYCHISEVAGAWIRNIRNIIRLDQQVVAKVLRVQKDSRQVDISIKRVSEQKKKDKIQEFKRQNAAIAMIHLIAERMDKDPIEIRKKIEKPFIKAYGSMYNGFEEMVISGVDAVKDMGFDEEFIKIMHEVALASIQLSLVEINVDLGIRSFAPNGVEHVKKLLYSAEKVLRKFPDINSEVTTVGAPHYRIHLEGKLFEEVEEVYEKIVSELENSSKKLDVEYKIERNDKR